MLEGLICSLRVYNEIDKGIFVEIIKEEWYPFEIFFKKREKFILKAFYLVDMMLNLAETSRQVD